MSTTLLAAFSLFKPVQSLLLHIGLPRTRPIAKVPRTDPLPVRELATVRFSDANSQPHAAPQRRPPALRVLRLADAGASHSHSGRMLISGRMADVCAELDRLAALEARQTRVAAGLSRASL